MAILILGLIAFIGVHCIRLAAPAWRDAQVARFGEQGWKGLYSAASLVGLVLIVWGYGVARRTPTVLWTPPIGARHLTALLVLVAFVLIAAAYVPGNRIKRTIGHPMMAGVSLWALGHLLANGTLNAVVLFVAFLVWGAVGVVVWRRRDAAAGVRYPATSRSSSPAWSLGPFLHSRCIAGSSA